MKKFAYTLVTTLSDSAQADLHDPALTLRETLIIEGGPRYHREYTLTSDGTGVATAAEEAPVA